MRMPTHIWKLKPDIIFLTIPFLAAILFRTVCTTTVHLNYDDLILVSRRGQNIRNSSKYGALQLDEHHVHGVSQSLTCLLNHLCLMCSGPCWRTMICGRDRSWQPTWPISGHLPTLWTPTPLPWIRCCTGRAPDSGRSMSRDFCITRLWCGLNN